MQIQFTKNSDKPHLIVYRRNDGSETWMHASEFFVLHDLSHFVLESELGYTDAFYGMLNKGMNPGDFENRETRQHAGMSLQASHAENLANLFLIEQVQGEFENFIAVAGDAWKTSFGNHVQPPLPEGHVVSIRKQLQQKLAAWKELEIGNTLILSFVI